METTIWDLLMNVEQVFIMILLLILLRVLSKKENRDLLRVQAISERIDQSRGILENVHSSIEFIDSSIEDLEEKISDMESSNQQIFTKIDQNLQFLVKNSTDMNIRMHVTEARLDERKNITIAQESIQRSSARKGWPKGKPRGKRTKEIEQK